MYDIAFLKVFKTHTCMKYNYLFVLVFLFLLISCQKEENVPWGGLKGRIEAFNEFGNRIANLAGIKVSLEGALSTTTITDATGSYAFQDLPVGNYNVIFERNDLSTFRRNRITVLEGFTSDVGLVKMVTPSTTISTELNALMTVESGFEVMFIRGLITPEGNEDQRREVRMFFSKTPNPSPSNYLTTVSAIDIRSGSFILYITIEEFRLRGFNRGDIVYLTGYGSSRIGDTYVDEVSKLQIFSGLNPKSSNIVSIRLAL